MSASSDGAVPAVRLFCLPHAGTGATLFRGWAAAVPPQVEVRTPQLPGREERIGDEPFTDLWSAVDWLNRVVSGYRELPVVLFGHSMGAALAFELARALTRDGRPPALLAVSGMDAPRHHVRRRHSGPPDDAELAARLAEAGTAPQRLFADPTLRELFLPGVRADYALVDTYSFHPGEPLDCPISVWGGLDDPLTTRDRLADWRDETRATTHLRMVAGGHLFIRDVWREMLPELLGDIADTADTADTAGHAGT